MEKAAKSVTALFVGASGWVSAKLGILAPLLLCFFAIMVIDYITGMMASRVEAIDHPGDDAYGWSSKKGLIGILKKVGYMCIVVTAMIIDYVIITVSGQIGYDMPVKGIFALMVVIWYILNETLSIAENAKRMHAPLPDWFGKYIAVMRSSVDHKFDYGDGEQRALDPGEESEEDA